MFYRKCKCIKCGKVQDVPGFHDADEGYHYSCECGADDFVEYNEPEKEEVKKDLEWKPFKNKCPNCNCEDLTYFGIEPEDCHIKQDVVCNNCDHDFVIWSNIKWEYGVEKNV